MVARWDDNLTGRLFAGLLRHGRYPNRMARIKNDPDFSNDFSNRSTSVMNNRFALCRQKGSVPPDVMTFMFGDAGVVGPDPLLGPAAALVPSEVQDDDVDDEEADANEDAAADEDLADNHAHGAQVGVDNVPGAEDDGGQGAGNVPVAEVVAEDDGGQVGTGNLPLAVVPVTEITLKYAKLSEIGRQFWELFVDLERSRLCCAHIGEHLNMLTQKASSDIDKMKQYSSN